MNKKKEEKNKQTNKFFSQIIFSALHFELWMISLHKKVAYHSLIIKFDINIHHYLHVKIANTIQIIAKTPMEKPSIIFTASSVLIFCVPKPFILLVPLLIFDWIHRIHKMKSPNATKTNTELIKMPIKNTAYIRDRSTLIHMHLGWFCVKNVINMFIVLRQCDFDGTILKKTMQIQNFQIKNVTILYSIAAAKLKLPCEFRKRIQFRLLS